MENREQFKNQWNKKLILWKNENYELTFILADRKEERKHKQYQEYENEYHYRSYLY